MNREKTEVLAIFRFFAARFNSFDNGYGQITCRQVSTSTLYDDGCEFLEAFSKVSPGRKKDPADKLLKARLDKRLRQMVRDGWMDRWRRSNQVEYHGEATWQYVYSPPSEIAHAWRVGRETPYETMRSYVGFNLPEQDWENEDCLASGKETHRQEHACIHCGASKPWADDARGRQAD